MAYCRFSSKPSEFGNDNYNILGRTILRSAAWSIARNCFESSPQKYQAIFNGTVIFASYMRSFIAAWIQSLVECRWVATAVLCWHWSTQKVFQSWVIQLTALVFLPWSYAQWVTLMIACMQKNVTLGTRTLLHCVNIILVDYLSNIYAQFEDSIF